MPVDLVRDAAIDVILRVFERNVPLDVSLDKTLRRKPMSDRGRRFLTHLAYGTIRHRRLCDHVLQKICLQPLDKLPPPIHAVLRMAIFQALFCAQVTRPAMVHTSVDLAKRRGHAGLARMVNAVLRKAPATLDEAALPDRSRGLPAYLGIRYSVPRWLLELWVAELGETTAEELCIASSEQAPPALRVNTLKTTVAELTEHLTHAGITVCKQTPVPEELTITEGGAILRTKWFQQGHFMLQDPASMLAAHLVEPRPGETVLDLCAAPGGKTTHLAELAGGQARVVAADADWARLHRVLENIERLESPGISVVCADGVRPPFRTGFDRVLADAPCSGLGTLRRHPDIKWRMSPEAISRLAELQVSLLRSAVQLCKNGGLVVYSVCTFSKQETQDVVQTVCHDGQVELEDGPEWLQPWKIAKGQYRMLPSAEAWDGFFLTRFRKAS
jgi:16S rRNA (cytosine967-C5)-methyltransferase